MNVPNAAAKATRLTGEASVGLDYYLSWHRTNS
jgi:hypothetical protein